MNGTGVAIMKNCMQMPQKLQTELAYNIVIPLRDTSPREMNLEYQRVTCMLIIIAALFAVDKIWKQSRHLLIKELRKKM